MDSAYALAVATVTFARKDSVIYYASRYDPRILSTFAVVKYIPGYMSKFPVPVQLPIVG